MKETSSGCPSRYRGMSPVHIPRGFTKAYIDGRGRRGPGGDDPGRPRGVRRRREMLLIEGTGHAGVGAVIGLSNAVVARMLGAPAVIVSEGGVGRPIDEIVLNAALFEREGVAGRRGDRQQGRLGASRARADPASAGSPATASRCSACCRTGRSCRTRPWRWSSRASTARPSTRARTSTGSSTASRSGRWSRTHARARRAAARWSSCPGDREDVIAAIVHAHRHRAARPEGDALGLVLTGGYRPAPAGPRRDPRGRPLRDARQGGHVRGRVGGPRPAGQDPRRRPRQDRDDQGASSGSTSTSTGCWRSPPRQAPAAA